MKGRERTEKGADFINYLGNVFLNSGKTLQPRIVTSSVINTANITAAGYPFVMRICA
jgi:hypothetical protein